MEQVQDALITISSLIQKDKSKKICVKVMIYNQFAEFIHLDQPLEDLKPKIKDIRAGGSTNFVDVFKKLSVFLHETPLSERKKTFVFFMTDGQDTFNKPSEIMESTEKLQDAIKQYTQDVIINVLGFSEDHDRKFLEKLTSIGTMDGSYNFIDVSDDVNLENRMIDLLDSTIYTIGKLLYLKIKINSPNLFLSDWFGERDDDIVIPAFLSLNEEDITIQTNKFVYLPNGVDDLLFTDINLFEKLNDSNPLNYKVDDISTVKLVDIDKEHLFLRKLKTGLNMITYKLSKTDNKENIDKNIKIMFEKIKILNEKHTEIHKINLRFFAIFIKSNKDAIQEIKDCVNKGIKICDRVFNDLKYKNKKLSRMTTTGSHSSFTSCSSTVYNQRAKKIFTDETSTSSRNQKFAD